MTATPGAPKSDAVRAVMMANRGRDTGPELRLRSALHRAGFRFRVNYRINSPVRPVRPDVVFPRRRVAVFVDGCFWHRCPSHGVQPTHNALYWQQKLDGNVARDRQVTEALTESGWTVVRIWEHVPVEEAVAEVARALRVETTKSHGNRKCDGDAASSGG